MGGLRDCLLVVWHRKWRYFGCQVTFFVKKGSGSLVGQALRAVGLTTVR